MTKDEFQAEFSRFGDAIEGMTNKQKAIAMLFPGAWAATMASSAIETAVTHPEWAAYWAKVFAEHDPGEMESLLKATSISRAEQ